MTLQFVPKPENDFPSFIETYYHRCRALFPPIDAIAGKWTFEDLIPGMSDFDTRFICSDGMTADDWCQMSMAVGQVHLDLCRSHPRWVRILEHLPGINLTWSELAGESTYYSEYRQWTFYHSSNPIRLEQSLDILNQRSWDEKDEYFHLKKFLYFYGPYDREIDPAVNLGAFENKYPLHSRLMHYFTPPIQSAMSILTQKPVIGKMQTLEMAREMFPQAGIFREVIDIVDKHYETPRLYHDPQLAQLERRLFDGLQLFLPGLEQIGPYCPISGGAHRRSGGNLSTILQLTR